MRTHSSLRPILAALALSALASIGTAQAQTAAPPPDAWTAHLQKTLAERFAKADADHDGRLTLAEAQGGMPRVAEHFAQLDVGHLGYLTLPQLQADLLQRMASKP